MGCRGGFLPCRGLGLAPPALPDGGFEGGCPPHEREWLQRQLWPREYAREENKSLISIFLRQTEKHMWKTSSFQFHLECRVSRVACRFAPLSTRHLH